MRQWPAMRLAALSSTAVLLLALPSAALSQSGGRAKVLEGNTRYSEGKFDEANNAYRDAQLDNPASPLIDYNIANTLYQKKDYEGALKIFDKCLKNSDDPSMQAKIYYNMGNALFRMNKLPESVLAYKDALKLRPDDQDAKYNLEYVRARLKENAEDQEQDQEQEQEKVKPSEYARKLKAEAEALVAERKYAQALKLMQDGIQVDETVKAFQSFIDRIQDIVSIAGGTAI